MRKGGCKSTDVVVYWVDVEPGRGSIVRKIEIDEHGDMDHWPDGVFIEDYEEILAIPTREPFEGIGALRIEIDAGAANNPDAHGSLDRILHKIEDGWHVWDTAREPDIEAIRASAWVGDQGRQGKRVREMLVRSIQREGWGSAPHGRRVRVTMHPDGQCELNPEEAGARLSEEPLVILVENRNSDGAFLDRVMTDLDKPLHKYGKDWKKEEGPVRLDSIGGKGEMPNEVERRTLGRRYRPRLVVIVDSDRKGPNEKASLDAQRLQRTCEKRNVPCLGSRQA